MPKKDRGTLEEQRRFLRRSQDSRRRRRDQTSRDAGVQPELAKPAAFWRGVVE